jgi:type II secretory pathway predicted ATPase ExeA/cell division protein FtsN
MPVEKYEPFFGLTEAPFSLAPDPRFLYASASISAALEQLAYALGRREPLIVVTGEIGTGKTLLCRAVLKRIPRETFLSVIDDPLLERDDLLKQMLEDFGVIAKDRTRLTETTRHELVEALQAFLRSLSAIQAHAVVAIDEAQHLRPDVLEQIRLLSNMNDERGTLLQIILVGQPELESLLSQPELRQLQQRVTRRFHLEPLNREEVREYIDHRLALARNGASRAPGAAELAHELAAWSSMKRDAQFTDEAVQAVFEISRGFPRVINLLCDRSLEAACASNLRVVDAFGINKAADALGLGSLGAPRVSSEESPAPGKQPRPEHSFWVAAPSESRPAPATVESLETFAADEAASADVPAASRQGPKYVLLAASLALVAFVAVWYGLRAATPQTPEAAPSTTTPAPPVNSAPNPPVASPSGAASAPAPQPAATPPARSATPPAGAPSGPASAPTTTTPANPPATPGAERFDIVVASFRTDARAAAVSTEIAALGLPVRRRVSDTWQQVIVGPFKSRQEADNAQQSLQRAGMGGTQIVPVR